MKQKTLTILAGCSVCLNAYLLLTDIDFPSGGGQYKASPDGRFIAHATSLQNKNPLARNRSIYGRISLDSAQGRGSPLTTVTIHPEKVRNEIGYRMTGEMIHWSKDSSRVTVSTPSGDFTLNLPPP